MKDGDFVKKIFVILVMMLCLCGCQKKESTDINIKPASYKELMETTDYVIVDVRTKDEFDSGHVVGAINIPYDEIDENVVLDKEKLIFVYCLSGGRSSIAEEALTNLGYDVYNLGAYENIDLPKE